MSQTNRVPMRARDLRVLIKELGFEAATVSALEHLLEEHGALKQHMNEIANLSVQIIEQIEIMVNVGDAMRRKMDEIKRVMDQGEASHDA